MGIIPAKKEVVEEIISLSDIDEVTCREKLKGDIDPEGRCVVRVRLDPNKPSVAELLQIRYTKTGKA